MVVTLRENADSMAARLQRLDAATALTETRALVESAYAPGVRIDDLASSLGRTAMSLYKALHRIRLTLVACTGKSLQERKAP